MIDNDSRDSSLEYLRSLSWIRLFERPGEVYKSGSWAHGTALDIGLGNTNTEFFVAMHSDTFIHREGWLEEFVKLADRIRPTDKNPGIACVGGGKLDLKPSWQVLLKQMTDLKSWIKKLKNGKRNDFYVRTICALYRTEILLKENLRFAMNVDDGMTCGKQLYYELIDRRYSTIPIPAGKMAEYIYHLAHATMVLNPEFTVRKHTEKKCRTKLEEILNSQLAREILNDDSLDRA